MPTRPNGNHTNYKSTLWKLAEYANPQGALEFEVDLYGEMEKVLVTERGPLLLTFDSRWRYLQNWPDFTSSEKKAMIYMVAKKNRAQRTLLEAAPKQLEMPASWQEDDEEALPVAHSEDTTSEFRRKQEEQRKALKDQVERRLQEVRFASYIRSAEEAQERHTRVQEAKAARDLEWKA
mmetsp:Transcript_81404/g.225437  ORF Transcript_81404/g.225437 Transcript_81404/m.225437 type:complete len:178 (-) Transcript_81404:186-719(-)